MFLLAGFVGYVHAGAGFTASTTSGTAPLTVQFTDTSTNNPTGWAWFFGDETYTAPWTQVTSGAGWSARLWHSSVVLPDGSIVLMGGSDSRGLKNDVWLSTDKGATWTQVNASAGWSGRDRHSSVALPDGSIVLMGGVEDWSIEKNDVWRSPDKGAMWTQVKPNDANGWSARLDHSSVVMPDGSIVLMGGADIIELYPKNDVWRSTDNGATWTRVNASAGWMGRYDHSSVVMPDGSIVLTGDYGGIILKNDTWWFKPAGSSEQNLSHTYTTPGIYSVSLQARNAYGYDIATRTSYITVYSAPVTTNAALDPVTDLTLALSAFAVGFIISKRS